MKAAVPHRLQTVLQQPTFLFCNFLQKGLAKNTILIYTNDDASAEDLFSMAAELINR